MPDTTFDETRIKELFKQAFLELVAEQRDLFYELFAQVLEDFAMVRAIDQGATSERVDRADVSRALEETA